MVSRARIFLEIKTIDLELEINVSTAVTAVGKSLS